MTWDSFIYFAITSLLAWIAGSVSAYTFKQSRKIPVIFMLIGLAVFMAFIVGLWQSLERPPLRTMGETRLWYSFFLPLAGLITYLRWNYKWILSFSTILSGVFIFINILNPDIHNKVLMPALQSPWFAPHVIIYMFSYALLAVSALLAVYYMIKSDKLNEITFTHAVDNIVYVGVCFLTLGMLMGAVWAKDAWGHYWSWDPKETWAAATWVAYMVYIHYRLKRTSSVRTAMWMLVVAFLLLQVCWYGVNYLPSAAQSVHTYSVG